MSKQESSLSYAVRPAVVFKLCGQLSLVLALLTLPPIMVALFCGEFRSAGVYAATAIVFAVIGWTLNRLPRPVSLQVNEAFVMAALAFLFISLAMTSPFMVAGLSPVDAFFEATSACTTTGLSTSEQVENKPTSLLFTRAWMQWYGGLGIVVFSIALIVHPGVLAKGLAAPESKEDELLSSTTIHARRVLFVYLVLTFLAVAILWVLSRNLFYAVTYALAAVSTGGFSPHNASLAGFGAAYMAPVVILFGIAGSMPLYLYFRAYTSGWWHFVRDSQAAAIGLACLLTAGVLTVLLGVVHQMVIRTCLPTHAVYEPHLAGRKLNELEIRDALVVAILFVGVIVTSWFVFLTMGEDPLGSLFEVVSATGTVGLSTGICRPELPALLKFVLCIDMLMGRLEVFAWLVVLHRGTWFGKRTD